MTRFDDKVSLRIYEESEFVNRTMAKVFKAETLIIKNQDPIEFQSISKEYFFYRSIIFF
jgi:hypothetical protein